MLDHGKPCCFLFGRDYYLNLRAECAGLTKDQLDLLILGQIMAQILCEEAVGPRSGKSLTPRQQSKVAYSHLRLKVCKQTFLHLHGIG